MKDKQSSENRNQDDGTKVNRETPVTRNEDKNKTMNQENNKGETNTPYKRSPEHSDDHELPADEDQDEPDKQGNDPSRQLPGKERPDEIEYPSRKPNIKEPEMK